MRYRTFICLAALAAWHAHASAAQKSAREPHAQTEVLTCRNGTEDRHARIAVVLVGGKTDSFAYYSKWKPRTCSIYLERKRDTHNRWRDNGALTTVNLERGQFLIEHKKGEYRFVFRDVDRQRYCGMDGLINGSLTIRKGSELCELTGVMEEGVKLGQAHLHTQPASAPAVVDTAAPVTVAVATPASATGARADGPSARSGASAGAWSSGWWRAQALQPKGSAWPASSGD